MKALIPWYRIEGAIGAHDINAPNCQKLLFIHGRPPIAPTQYGTHALPNLNGHISLIPTRAELTD